MVIYKKAAKPGDQKRAKPKVASDEELKKITIRVALDGDGNLCAADIDQGIFTECKDEEERMRNIIEAVESDLRLPRGKVSISNKSPEAYLN